MECEGEVRGGGYWAECRGGRRLSGWYGVTGLGVRASSTVCGPNLKLNNNITWSWLCSARVLFIVIEPPFEHRVNELLPCFFSRTATYFTMLS